jgi:phospholipase C
MRLRLRLLSLLVPAALMFVSVRPVFADGNLHNVKHIIIVMQENHSFDNYFGALAYAPGSPYHNNGNGCRTGDHDCVNGLTCTKDNAGNFTCSNSNPDDDGSTVFVFHDSRRCAGPDLDHGWFSTHREANFESPNNTLFQDLSDGFVRVNDITEQTDNGVENPTDDQSMGFFTQNEIPFYYDLAQKFALDDSYHASVLGPTFPNRSYLMAATSFGHLTTSDTFPPPGGYKPITGTIFDLLESHNVTWADYFQDAPQAGSFRTFSLVPGGPTDPHLLPLSVFLAQAKAGALPQVSFVDPNFGLFGPTRENDEHPPTDIQRGQAYVSQVINAVRNGPNWKDTVLIVTYDEHGGFYDHAKSPRARQGHAPNPDGINPGQCADLSNPSASEQPGGGAECSSNLLSKTDTSVNDAIELCPQLAADPTGPYPAACANFDQYGVRVPFLAISPFSKPHYVSHTTGDHTSLLALIEKTFMSTTGTPGKHDGDQDADDDDDNGGSHPFLTKRDQHANSLEDLFDFDRSPSLNTTVGVALPPTDDCTPK